MRRLGTAFVLVLAVGPLSAGGQMVEAGTKVLAPASVRIAPIAAAQTVHIQGAPADLVAVMSRVYNKQALTGHATQRAARALLPRTRAAGPVSGMATTGVWKRTPIAVVAVGRDVTLAYKTNRWIVVGGWWPSLGIRRAELGGIRRVLAIGGDAREGGGTHPHEIAAGTVVRRSHADSLHIIGFDGRGGAGMLGIPRDTYAKLSTGGPKQKINGAMKKRGPRAQQRTVTNFTGVRLEGYVLTGFRGFTHMVNTLGPVRITLPRRVQILNAPSPRDLPKGLQNLLGVRALDLARARKHVRRGDMGRSWHQGLILLSAAAQARNRGPLAIPGMLNRAAPYLETNLSPGQMLTFVANVYRVRPLRVVNKVAVGKEAKRGGRYVVIAGKTARKLYRDIRDGNLRR